MDKVEFLKISITPDYFYPDEAGAIEACLARGYDYVHIRKPGSSAEQVRALIDSINPDLRARLALHDHFELAAGLGVGGVHLNRRNPSTPSGWTGRLSASCHSPEECPDYKSFDYVTLSPVYPSISKPGYKPAFTLADCDVLLNSSDRPAVVALGGIQESNLPALQAMGFDGAALLSGAWRRTLDPQQFRLQFITHPRSVAEAEAQVEAVLGGGCRWVQLRWKEAPDGEYLHAARRIEPLCRRYGAIFLLNDCAHLVQEARADGVHLGKNDMSVGEARSFLGPGVIIGRTANTPEDVLEGLFAGADYIGLGPFRFTGTKKNLSPILGLDGYRRALDALRQQGLTIPIVAIGGITEADVSAIMATGVQGIAVSGAIINSANPSATTRTLLSKN